MAIIIETFSDSNPVTHDKLNAALETLVGLVNALSGAVVVQLGTPGNSGTVALLTGATFLGQVRVPSLLIGPAGAQQAPVLPTHYASGVTGGTVLLATKLDALSQAISNPPTQAEVSALQALLNSLIAGQKTAKQMANV